MSALSWQAWLTLVVITATVVMLARDLVAPAVAVLGADIGLMVAGVISPGEAFAGFSNPAPITVAALFVVARAVEKTGALQPLLALALGKGGKGRSDLLRLLVPTAGASAFLNNTPIVAMLAPQIADWAEKRGRPASHYLMPLSFATILGGTLTVIGTSTNLVVSGLLQQHGMPPLGMFEITRVGLPLAVVGLGTLALLAPRLLPDRRPARKSFEEEIREFVFPMMVRVGGSIDGKTVEAGGLRNLQGVFLAEIERNGEVIAPAAPSTVLHGGDRLTFVGKVAQVHDLQSIRGLVSAEQKHSHGFDSTVDHTFYEVVVSAASPLIAKTLRESDFRSRYQAVVLAIHRAGARVDAKLGAVRLKEGDTLLVLSDREFRNRWRDRSDFLLVSHLGGAPLPSSRQAFFVLAVTALIVLVAGAGLLPILHASLLGAIAVVLARVLRPAEAQGAVSMDVIVMIAASFGLGAALEQSGLAGLLASLIGDGMQSWGPGAALLAITVATVALTELITNNAAAVLLFPITVATATRMDADPRPFIIAVTIAASASFLTPIGYQTNTMVYGMGGYRFGDFVRLGAPLTLVVIVTVSLLVPLFWPF